MSQQLDNLESNSQNKQVNEFSLKEFILRYIRVLPWILLSVVIFLAGAYVKLRYSTTLYKVSGKLMIKKDGNSQRGDEKFDAIFMMQSGQQNLGDQMELLRSSPMAKRVVRLMDLQTSYYNVGNVRSTLIHPKESPIRLRILEQTDSLAPFTLKLWILGDQQFKVSEEGKVYQFGEPVQLNAALVTILATNQSFSNFASSVYEIRWLPEETAARELASSIVVVQAGEINSNVLQISQETENPRLGKDIIDTYLSAYKQFNLEDKQESALGSLSFIDQQLDTVRGDLDNVERRLLTFRQEHNIVNIDQQSQLFFNNILESEKGIFDVQVKIKVVDQLIGYLNSSDPQRIISPVSLDIQEPSLIRLISEYNNLQLRKETEFSSIPENNPVFQNIQAGISKLKGDILENLRSVKNAYQISLRDLQTKEKLSQKEVGAVPAFQKAMLEIERQQKITEELYSFLLQKRLETSIGAASTFSNIRIVEPASFSNIPVAPNKKGVYMLAFAIGLVLPAGIIYLVEILNDKVRSRTDVEKATGAPVVAEIGHAQEKQALVVTHGNRKFIAEQFRILRSNLQYILPGNQNPRILVTSSFSGEGKSFISTNLGAVVAVSGKKTVILEFDIRKPKVIEGLGMKIRKGMTNFIVGDTTLDEIVYPVPSVQNLYVIPCGPIPPNPSELLLNKKIEFLFEELNERFDAIIIDTAPVGLVSDALTLGKYADATIYIVRHQYTHRKQLQLINELYEQKKMPSLSIVINDIEIKNGYSGGYYGYGSYGYGYGYGSDYFEKESKVGTNIWKRWFSKKNK